MSTRTRLTHVGLAAAATVVLGASAATAQAPASIPAAPPTDARAANLTVLTTTVPSGRLGGPGSRYPLGGGTVRVGPTSAARFTAFQAVTVDPPTGRVVLQGFATVSGGLTGSMVITSAATSRGRFTVRLSFPGEQGVNGRLTIRVQTVPRAGG